MSDAPGDKGTLFLIPVALGGGNANQLLPVATLDAARALRTFIVEDAKSARRFLKSIAHPSPLQALDIREFNEHSRPDAVEALISPLLAGVSCGLLSEAGCPAIADPGAALVRRAHAAGVRVEPLVGPSAILLALMASGLNGQHFTFHGYLPADRQERARRLRTLEARAAGETQIFIETPYRNAVLLDALLAVCRGDTLLGIATDLTLPRGAVRTRTIAAWKAEPPELDRRPSVFLLYRD